MSSARSFFALIVFAGLLPAQDPATAPVAAEHSLALVAGRGRLLRFAREVSRVAVAEPKIADAVVVSPREIMVNGKTPGHTTLVIWEADSEPVQYNVQVLQDTTFLETLRRELKERLPEAEIKVDGTPEKMVLTGTARDEEEVKRAVALASPMRAWWRIWSSCRRGRIRARSCCRSSSPAWIGWP
jgi:Flp pilus assembly secretin CpaC